MRGFALALLGALGGEKCLPQRAQRTVKKDDSRGLTLKKDAFDCTNFLIMVQEIYTTAMVFSRRKRGIDDLGRLEVIKEALKVSDDHGEIEKLI